jgi:putative membrane protein
MERAAGWIVAVLAALAGASCAPRTSETVDCADVVLSPSQYSMQWWGRPGIVSNDEVQFVCRAAVYGRAQLLNAQLAEQRSSNPAVRQFAAATATAQGEFDRQLRLIAAQQDGIMLPSGLTTAGIETRDRLAPLSNDSFDRAYLQAALQDGRTAVALFRSGSGLPQPAMAGFAQRTLPQLEQRVSAAENLLRESG